MSSKAPAREAHASDAIAEFPIDIIFLGVNLADAEYDSQDQLLEAYISHAFKNGYAVVLDYKCSKSKLPKFIYMCDRSRKPRDRKNTDLYKSKRRPNTGSQKCNCPFCIYAKQREDRKWEGTIAEKQAYYNY